MGELYNPYPKLPKNIRQIGERDQVVKLYVEDYVNTYLKSLHPVGGQDLRVGLLLGNVEMHEGTPYIFIDGALEMEDVTEDGERVVFSEAAWKKAYECMEQMFPKRTIQGWFLCGEQGCQLSPLNYWKQHGQYFAEKYKLMYLNSGLEGEEAVYITSEDGFYRLQGHCIYYERNQMMQDYMILRKDVRRVEAGVNDRVIRDFRQRMDDRKVQMTSRRNTVGFLSGLCSVLSIAVLAGGIVMFNNYQKMRQMEGVIASVLPEGAAFLEGGQDGSAGGQQGVEIEEAAGEISPTEAGGQERQPAGTSRKVQDQNEQKQLIITQETLGSPESGGAAAQGSETQSIQDGREKEPSAAAGQTESAPEPPAEIPAQTEASSDGQGNKGGQETGKTKSVSADGKTYTVQEGETLFKICMKLYHNPDQMDEICRLNGLDDANRIEIGQKLVLP